MRTKYLIGITLTVLLLVSGISLALALIGATERKSTEEQVTQSLERYQDELAFEILVPSYLPSGTSRTPSEISVDGDYITFKLLPTDNNQEGADFAAVFIRQGFPTDGSCGLRFVHYRQETTIAGQSVQMDKVSHPGSLVRVMLFAQPAGICLNVEVGWFADESELLPEIELSPEMENEAMKVFESILRNVTAPTD